MKMDRGVPCIFGFGRNYTHLQHSTIANAIRSPNPKTVAISSRTICKMVTSFSAKGGQGVLDTYKVTACTILHVHTHIQVQSHVAGSQKWPQGSWENSKHSVSCLENLSYLNWK